MKKLSLTCHLIIIVFTLSLFSCSSLIKEKIILENGHFRYEISGSGKNLAFIDKATGTDYLFHDTVSYCAYVIQEGEHTILQE